MHLRGIRAVQRDQLVMGALFHHNTLVEDHDPVGVAHRGEAVGEELIREQEEKFISRARHIEVQLVVGADEPQRAEVAVGPHVQLVADLHRLEHMAGEEAARNAPHVQFDAGVIVRRVGERIGAPLPIGQAAPPLHPARPDKPELLSPRDVPRRRPA